ncbi:uncharacterized protein MELLADRAFT_39014, partial [Melampsora larici-populina 98AG31]
SLFEDINLAVIHTRCVTIQPKDIQLAHCLCKLLSTVYQCFMMASNSFDDSTM